MSDKTEKGNEVEICAIVDLRQRKCQTVLKNESVLPYYETFS